MILDSWFSPAKWKKKNKRNPQTGHRWMNFNSENDFFFHYLSLILFIKNTGDGHNNRCNMIRIRECLNSFWDTADCMVLALWASLCKEEQLLEVIICYFLVKVIGAVLIIHSLKLIAP